MKPQSTSRVNPFLSQNWKDQLDKILRQLGRKGKTREDKIKSIEAYLYLGILIEAQNSKKTQIKEILQKSQGERKTRDIWKGAELFQKIFTRRPKDLLYQTTYITITNIVKLTEKKFKDLLAKLKT